MVTSPSVVKTTNGGGFAAISVPSPIATSTSAAVNPAASAAPVTLQSRCSVDPHSFVHKKLTKAQKAVHGAEILDGAYNLLNPTRGLVAHALGVSVGYIDMARRLSPAARREVVRGHRSLTNGRG